MKLKKIKPGDKIYFACGGMSVIREINIDADDSESCYPFRIKLNGFHAGNDYWTYSESGECGQGTGPDDFCPFDIVAIKKNKKGD